MRELNQVPEGVSVPRVWRPSSRFLNELEPSAGRSGVLSPGGRKFAGRHCNSDELPAVAFNSIRYAGDRPKRGSLTSKDIENELSVLYVRPFRLKEPRSSHSDGCERAGEVSGVEA